MICQLIALPIGWMATFWSCSAAPKRSINGFKSTFLNWWVKSRLWSCLDWVVALNVFIGYKLLVIYFKGHTIRSIIAFIYLLRFCDRKWASVSIFCVIILGRNFISRKKKGSRESTSWHCFKQLQEDAVIPQERVWCDLGAFASCTGVAAKWPSVRGPHSYHVGHVHATRVTDGKP